VEGSTHLLYHCYPVLTGERVFRWNVDQLLRRKDRFTGHKFVGVATSTQTLPFSEVRRLFPDDWQVVEIPNGRLREVATWQVGWPTLENLDGQVFFAHAKGVTRQSRDYEEQAVKWTEMMYHTLLDFPLQVGEVLKKYSLAGSFKKVCRGFDPDSKSPWHYHGAFYWVRSDFYSKWRDIIPIWFGVESWPGDVQPEPSQAGCVFGDGGPKLNLYNTTFCQETWKEMEQWERTTADFIAQAATPASFSTTP
jgi:hypothetical protein